MTGVLLRVENLRKSFPSGGRRRQSVQALVGVDLAVRRGETLAIVGESGCGKSTLARCLVRLYQPDEGRIVYDGIDIGRLRGADLRSFNRRVQMVFQDPYGSLNPRMTVGAMLAEPLRVHGICHSRDVPARVYALLNLVHLAREAATRYPHEFSGGQRQRIGIARALALAPDCLIADEPVSALDVSVQAQIINLLLELQRTLHLTVVLIAHDLRLVRHVAHRVAVMYLGRIVELADTAAFFDRPYHPYSQALLRAVPDIDPANRTRAEAIVGELPSPLQPPKGCVFHPRCGHAVERCDIEVPLLEGMVDGRLCACHLARQGDRPDDSLAGWDCVAPKTRRVV